MEIGKIMQIAPNYINHRVAVQLDIATYKKIEEALENYSLYQNMQETYEENNEVLSFKDAREYYGKLDKAK